MFKINRKLILEGAFNLLRDKGHNATNARSIAEVVGCSVQPIYSYYKNMEELMEELYVYSKTFYLEFVNISSDISNTFEEAGKSHIRFAREERNLFQFLFTSDYTRLGSFNELYEQFGKEEVTKFISKTWKIEENKAKELYTNMMIYTHGIASLIGNSSYGLSDEEIFNMVDKACFAFFLQVGKDEV